MKRIHREGWQNGVLKERLTIDCENCCGLCCTALYFSRSEGFPADKEPGRPCRELLPDFRCSVHSELAARGLKGCMAFDCLGAGQKVTQSIYGGRNWRQMPELAPEMFEVFLAVWQLHQMLWYLAEASEFLAAEELRDEISTLISENERMTGLKPEEILAQDIEGYRERANGLLKKANKLALTAAGGRQEQSGSADLIGRNFKKARLDGRDFSMALLIASNLSGCSLRGASFLGADLRDANLCDADLSESIFLTQGQVNSAKGNQGTKLPAALICPEIWKR